MNRPERRNALSRAHMEELIACLKAIGQDRDIAVVILKGNGPVFSAGHDLSEMIGQEPAFYRQLFAICAALMETIQTIPQPVIAQVHGIATAAGCQLVATCDLAVAAEEARFATPGVKIGLFCSTPMVALSRAIGRKKAMEMLLTGDLIPASEALATGLVNKVVPAAELEGATRALAEKIAASSQLVVGLGKQAFYRQLEMPQHQAYDYTMEVMSFNATFADAQEGMCAFLEKRHPTWRGK
jgi:enoyl-CoA hydratase/carnithine racemase